MYPEQQCRRRGRLRLGRHAKTAGAHRLPAAGTVTTLKTADRATPLKANATETADRATPLKANAALSQNDQNPEDQLQVAPFSLKPVGAAELPVWVAW
ncbi:hypothetical protein GCM10009828_102940 [Actinoplanes couchii]|uniref:Uncharacterized protein n=1 Tax=Actinoplanes couchii TaxID=403638 RepID=A0ABQ3XS64_9ACTN|nr:hypothetical protein Aco03nite_097630 [Actinoplanes couchii]